MNILVKRLALGASFVLMMGVTVVSQSPLRLDFFGNAEAWIRRPVATAAVVTTVAVSSASASAAASANASATAAATANANAAAANANAAAAASKTAAPPPIGTIVTVLPPGCVPVTLNDVAYQRCGTTYYGAAMMGSNLVFVVKQP